jgi:hypothetical protein
MFLIFAAAYVCLLVPGALLRFSFDRYAMPLIPLLMICALISVQGTVRNIPAAAWACVLLFAAYGVVTTHDYARALEARALAAQPLVNKGVSPLHISGGLERDGWPQLQTVGKIESLTHKEYPAPSYNRFFFWYFTTAIQPDYVAVSENLSDAPKKRSRDCAVCQLVSPIEASDICSEESRYTKAKRLRSLE